MSFINSVISFFLIVERNIFYFFFNIVLNGNSTVFNINDINNVKNGNGKNVNDVKKFMKDKNSNDDLNSHLNGKRKSFAVISPVTSNNDLTIELHDTDLYDSPV
jgi:hypothetical protein